MKKLYPLIVVLCGGSAFAQSTSSPSNFKYHDLPNGQRIFVPFNSPLPSSAQQNGLQLWNQAMSMTPSGDVEVGRTVKIATPNGSPIDVTAKGRLPAPQVAKAVGRVLGAVVGPIGIGIAIYDLAKELGYTLSSNSSGVSGVTFTDPSICTTAPCVKYQFRTSAPASTFVQACQNGLGQGQSTGYGYMVYTRVIAAASYGCNMESTNANGTFELGYQTLNNFESPPAASNQVASSRAEFEAAVGAKSGWPQSSKVNDVVLADPDASLQVPQNIVVSGPASTPGPVSTTNNTTNNTTSRSTTTYNNTYAGDTMTTNVSTVNITTNNSTGAITSTETTTSTPPAAPPAPPPSITCGLPGTPACKLDESGTPSGVGTTYDTAKTAIDTAKTSAETNIGGAASIAAPAWSFSFALPTGCAPYVTGIKGVVLNVCQYQPTIHGLLSVIWAAATAFAMIGMVGRTIREA